MAKQNSNGRYILKVLERLRKPATFSEIVDKVAEETQIAPERLNYSIEQALVGGVEYGFINLQKGKFIPAPLSVRARAKPLFDDSSDEEEAIVEDANEEIQATGTKEDKDSGIEAMVEDADQASQANGAKNVRFAEYNEVITYSRKSETIHYDVMKPGGD